MFFFFFQKSFSFNRRWEEQCNCFRIKAWFLQLIWPSERGTDTLIMVTAIFSRNGRKKQPSESMYCWCSCHKWLDCIFVIITVASSNFIVAAISNINVHILGVKIHKSNIRNPASWMQIGIHAGLVLRLEQFVASWRAILWWTQAVPQPSFLAELQAVTLTLPC